MLVITEITELREIFKYHINFNAPNFFPVDFTQWKKSFTEDVDGEGRALFRELDTKAAYDGGRLVGFVQYGRSAFGFDPQGGISSEISYPIIRNLYFDRNRGDAGRLLLNTALEQLGKGEKVYAFFHYFGMSCFGRHGKLSDQCTHIEAFLKENGFDTEHENVYYSSLLADTAETAVKLVPQGVTQGDQQYFDFLLSGETVGGCELHYVHDRGAYLRWIYVREDLAGKGIGTQCMYAIKCWLYRSGFTRLDTDTAITNLVAQHFYEKNDFTREGITRSFFLPLSQT